MQLLTMACMMNLLPTLLLIGPGPLGFELQDTPQALVAVVRGEIDMSNAPSFEARLHAAVNRHRHLIVDLSAVAYLDLNALRCLEAAHRRAGELDRRLVLVGSSPTVHRVLEIAQVDRIIRTFASRIEALEFVRE